MQATLIFYCLRPDSSQFYNEFLPNEGQVSVVKGRKESFLAVIYCILAICSKVATKPFRHQEPTNIKNPYKSVSGCET